MDKTIEKIVSLCKRRGFIFQSSEIYGGFSAVYDYGPLGVELKNNLSQLWWKEMTQNHDNIVGLDSGILMHPKIWEASGHVGAFNDPLVDCKRCKSRFRADEVVEEINNQNWADVQCPSCGAIGSLTEPRQFNLMFKTNVGPVEETGIIFEVERGQTTTNNNDVLDLWKCHICTHADYLFLFVPMKLRHNEKMNPQNQYVKVNNRLESFFDTEGANYTNVRGLVVFGY